MSHKKALFEDDDSDEDINVLRINKEYAAKYDIFRVKEELQKFQGYSDIESASSSESSSEEECPFKNQQYVLDYYLTMGALESKDPKLYKKRFFKDSYDEPEKQKKEKPLLLAEYQRDMLLQKKGELSEEEETDEDEKPTGYLIKDSDKREERKPFKFEDDGVSDEEDELFKAAEKPKHGPHDGKDMNVAEEAVQFIKGNIDSMNNKYHQGILQHLKKDYNKPDTDEKEKFLDNFFMNYALEPDSEYSDDNCIEDEQSLSGDEDTCRKMQEFDNLHRFRYEEDNEELIKNYPRLIVNSTKIKENKRRKKRLEIKERKKKAKADRIREYRTLKGMELENKLNELRKSAGFDVNLSQKELDGVFDLESHSKVMDNLFNDNFYDQEDKDEEKPQFEEDDPDQYGDYDEWMEKNGVTINDHGGERSGVGDADDDAEYDDEEDYEPEEPEKVTAMDQLKSAAGPSRQRKRSKFAEALLRKKRTFDPAKCSFDQYYQKNYGLECEDFIGDIPIKFKYRSVHQNNYGLSTGDILQATDGELNQWVSWKKVTRYQRTDEEEMTDHIRYKIKSKNANKMKRILPSLFEDPEAAYAEEEEKKRNKYEKKKARKHRRKDLLKRKRRHGKTDDDDLPPQKKAKTTEDNCTINGTSPKVKENPVEIQFETGESSKIKDTTKGKNENTVEIQFGTGESSKIKHTTMGKNEKTVEIQFGTGESSKIKHTTKGKNEKTVKIQFGTGQSSKIKHTTKGKKENPKVEDSNNSGIADLIDESRLAAFNLNPKKAAKRIKHGKKI